MPVVADVASSCIQDIGDATKLARQAAGVCLAAHSPQAGSPRARVPISSNPGRVCSGSGHLWS